MQLNNVVATRAGKKIYKEDGDLIKLFDKSYSKSNILNEALNQARIEETGLNIPSLHKVTQTDGKWAIVMDYVEGKTLEELIKENPEKTDEYMQMFVEAQINIHSKKSPLLTLLNDKMTRKINDTSLSKPIKYDLLSRLAGFEKHDKVLHGDFQLSNVIVGNDGKIYIIDWAHATQGNASADAAMSYLLMVIDGKNDLAEKYLKLFCDKTNTALHYVKSWIPIVAASQLIKYASHADMLNKFIDVIEFQ